jgi:glycosyltransferase involved in cell wall biosynthesis
VTWATDHVTEPILSVIVPFFNREPYLDACVEALLAQEDAGGPVEIILVDNGSTDRGRSVAERHPGITLLREDKRGAYAARNTGLRAARAPIIAFTDADCTVSRDWVRRVCEGMGDPATGIMVGRSDYPAEASFALKLLATYENAKADYVASRCAPAHHFAYANNMAVRASVFAEVGPFQEWDRAADTELVHRLAARRPDLRLVFNRAMRVTHREFLRLRDRLGRLSLYTQTNAQIPTFKELGPRERLGVLAHMLRGEQPRP